jgi:Flp pilus assembly protein TadD
MIEIADLFAQALEFHNAGRWRQAEKIYLQILEYDPFHADTQHIFGVLNLQQGRLREAVTRIGRAIELNPSESSYFCNIGLAYQKLGETKNAVSSYLNSVRLDPQCALAHCVLGKLLAAEGRLEEAVTHCQEALRIRPQFPEAHDYLGLALAGQGKQDEAVAQFRLAVELDPNSARAHMNLTRALENQGKLEESEIHGRIAQSLQTKPGEADAKPEDRRFALPPNNWSFHAPQMASQNFRPERLRYDRGTHDDDRLKYILYFLDVRRKSVLELGPLEGHHTLILAKMGADPIIGLEARQENIDKCNHMIGLHKLPALVEKRDIEEMVSLGLSVRQEGFDLVFNCGFLYHTSNPAACLEWCRKQAPQLFLGTHYYDPGAPPPGYRRGKIEHNGKIYEGLIGQEVNHYPTQAIGPNSFWAQEADLVTMLRAAGYTRIDVLGKELHNDRPHITIMAD